jgi:hypothetical protein
MTRSLAFHLALLACLTAGTASAGAPAKPAVKEPEVTTIGTTPAMLSDADRAKLVEVEHRLAARRALPASHSLAFRRSWPGTGVKPAEISTRIPSRGARVRTKPGQTLPPAPAAVQAKPVAPSATQAAPAKGGRP